MPPLVDERTLARTYAHPSAADPYAIVVQYREAMQYPEDAGSTHVARELAVPRGRVRPWLDGSTPDPVAAIETAAASGWLADQWTPPVSGLALLCAGVFACGGVRRQGWAPSWLPATDSGRTGIETALAAVGVSHRTVSGSDTRSTELRPGSHSSILGRALAVAGAPVGRKATARALALPEWLPDAPGELRRRVAALFVAERGIEYADKATRRIQVDRPEAYYRDLAQLIAAETGEQVTVSDSGITVSAAAVRALDV